jgi:hypothetical protein
VTKHYVEAFIDRDGIGSRLVCEDETTCDQTQPAFRETHGCAIRDWYENTGPELLDYPAATESPTFGRIQVGCVWEGGAEDAELFLRPPGGAQ